MAAEITPLPEPPLRSDTPGTFNTKAETFLSALPQFQEETNALAVDVEGSAADAAASRAGAEAALEDVLANADPDLAKTLIEDGVEIDGEALLRLFISPAGKRLFGLTEEFLPKLYNGLDIGTATAGFKIRVGYTNEPNLPLIFVDSEGKMFEFGGGGSGGSAVELIHLLVNGQSLSTGAEALPALSTEGSPWGYKFTRGPLTWQSSDNPEDPEARSAAGFDLTQIAEEESAGAGETISTAMATQARSHLIGWNPPEDVLNNPDKIYLVSGVGRGSSRLAEIDQRDDRTEAANPDSIPGGNFRTMIDDVRRGKAAADARGWRYRVGWLNNMQGEENRDRRILNRSPAEAQLAPADFVAAYAEDMADYHTAASDEIFDITGQRIFSLWYQTLDANVGTAQTRACADNDDIYMAGPIWPYPTARNSSYGTGGATKGSDIHLSADGERWYGCKQGQVGALILAGRDWKPLQPAMDSNRQAIPPRISADRQSIWMDFDVPAPPLMIDTAFFEKARGWGIAPRTSGGTFYYADRIDVENGTRLRLEFDTPIPAGTLYMAAVFDNMIGQLPGTIVSVGSGADFDDDNPATEIVVTGDVRPYLNKVAAEGAFLILPHDQADGQMLNNGTPVREYSYSGGETTLRVITAELGAGTFDATDPAPKYGRDNPFCNVRDSDPARAMFGFSGTIGLGPYKHSGRYPLPNWLVCFDHSIEAIAIEEL